MCVCVGGFSDGSRGGVWVPPVSDWSGTPHPPHVSPPQCYLFHMYVGVRAGGGIGDEIEDPAGDEYELYRVVFDITFFFFVIVILLAIIQGERGGGAGLGGAGGSAGQGCWAGE